MIIIAFVAALASVLFYFLGAPVFAASLGVTAGVLMVFLSFSYLLVIAEFVVAFILRSYVFYENTFFMGWGFSLAISVITVTTVLFIATFIYTMIAAKKN